MEKAICNDRLYCPDCHDETMGEMAETSPEITYPTDYAQPAEYGEPVCMFCGCETLIDYRCSQCPSQDSLTEVEGTLYCPDCRPVAITVTVTELDLMIMALEFVADWGGVNVNVPEAGEKTRELINKLYHVGDNLDLLLTRSRKPVEPEPESKPEPAHSYDITITDRDWKGLSQTWCGVDRGTADKVSDILNEKPKPACACGLLEKQGEGK